MDEISELLKIDVERAVGFKIKSTTEAKNLHKLLIEKTNSSISLSTIRRIWKLTPSRKPNQKTLDELAKFIDFKSFLDYNKHKSNNSVWFDILQLNDLKFKDSLSKKDMEMLASYFLTHKSPIFHLNIIEHAIVTKNWQIIFDVFDPKKNTLNISNDIICEYSAKISNLVLEFLNHLPKDKFNETIQVLAHNPNFKNHCIYTFIDVLDLNKRYGEIIKEVKKSYLNQEEKLFLSLIDGLNNYLNTQSITKIDLLDPIDLIQFPSVLIGRYFGYQILNFSFNSQHKKEETLWKQYMQLISNSNNKRDLLHEFVIHMILGKKMNKLEILLEKFHDEIFDNVRFHNYIDQFIFNLIDVIVSLNQNDVKRAVTVFSNLSIKKFFDNSYCDYYLIFYHLVGSNLPLSKNRLAIHKLNFHKLAQDSEFNLFSEKYRKEYFNNTNIERKSSQVIHKTTKNNPDI